MASVSPTASASSTATVNVMQVYLVSENTSDQVFRRLLPNAAEDGICAENNLIEIDDLIPPTSQEDEEEDLFPQKESGTRAYTNLTAKCASTNPGESLIDVESKTGTNYLHIIPLFVQVRKNTVCSIEIEKAAVKISNYAQLQTALTLAGQNKQQGRRWNRMVVAINHPNQRRTITIPSFALDQLQEDSILKLGSYVDECNLDREDEGFQLVESSTS